MLRALIKICELKLYLELRSKECPINKRNNGKTQLVGSS